MEQKHEGISWLFLQWFPIREASACLLFAKLPSKWEIHRLATYNIHTMLATSYTLLKILRKQNNYKISIRMGVQLAYLSLFIPLSEQNFLFSWNYMIKKGTKFRIKVSLFHVIVLYKLWLHSFVNQQRYTEGKPADKPILPTVVECKTNIQNWSFLTDQGLQIKRHRTCKELSKDLVTKGQKNFHSLWKEEFCYHSITFCRSFLHWFLYCFIHTPHKPSKT